jgi:hypothetical protein
MCINYLEHSKLKIKKESSEIDETFSSKPVWAVHVERKNMAKPPKTCHGLYVPLADISAPGNTNEKNPGIRYCVSQ